MRVVVDDRTSCLASFPVAGGEVRPVTTGRRVVSGITPRGGGTFACLTATANAVPEVYALEGGKTPTLFLSGDRDFNVPSIGVEQMYQALKSLGVDTRMIIYPGQFHVLTTPSHARDRLQRFLDWFNKYLPAPAAYR